MVSLSSVSETSRASSVTSPISRPRSVSQMAWSPAPICASAGSNHRSEKAKVNFTGMTRGIGPP